MASDKNVYRICLVIDRICIYKLIKVYKILLKAVQINIKKEFYKENITIP